MSKYKKYKNRIIELAKENDFKFSVVAKQLAKEKNLTYGGALNECCKKIISALSSGPTELKEKVTTKTPANIMDNSNHSFEFMLNAL